MKRIFLTFVAVIAVCASMVGCKAFTQLSSGESTTGKPYEMVLICGQHEWQSELGDTLRSVFKQPVAEIVQYEPMFDVIRIMPNNFKSLTKRHRNIVSIIVDASISESEINVDYDVTGSIGKRYRRQDEIGTPYCITVDFETLEDNAVTVRDRDTMKQDRVSIDKIRDYIEEKLVF